MKNMKQILENKFTHMMKSIKSENAAGYTYENDIEVLFVDFDGKSTRKEKTIVKAFAKWLLKYNERHATNYVFDFTIADK